MMTLVSQTLALYKKAFVEASKKFFRSFILFPAATAAYFFSQLALNLIQPFGFLLVVLIYGAIFFTLLGLFYSWLITIHTTGKLRWDDLLTLDIELRQSLGSVGMVLFVVYLTSNFLAQGAGATILLVLLKVAMALAFNPLAEIIIINRPQGLSAFREAQEFARANAPEWFFFVGLLFLPVLLLYGPQAVLLFSAFDLLMPSRTLLSTSLLLFGWYLPLPEVLTTLVSILAALWLTLVRLEVFALLNSGTRRQRAFKARMQ